MGQRSKAANTIEYRQKPRILNVNDDESSLYVVSRILQKEGFEVLEATTGNEGLAIARREKPHLILLDVKLPDISGFEVCRLLKSDQATSHIPILHLTANALSTEHKVKSIQEGADAYLTFPLEPPFLVATVRSLLRLKQAESEREALLEAEQAKSEKLQSLLKELERERHLREQFIATLTHDLRGPLTAIKMSAYLILRKPEEMEALNRQCGRILTNANRADQMIQDLLDASLVRAGERIPLKLETTDLRELAHETVDELITTHGDRFVVDIPDTIVGLFDRSGIRRTFENLLQNAVKYGSASDPIVLSIYSLPQDRVCIAVHNRGNPISDEAKAGLFDLFRRTDSAQKSGKRGWGLGLTLVRGMAEAHGGTVRVESSVDTGTKFILDLPLKVTKQDLRIAQ